MQTEIFKIKNADCVEIELEVLTADNVKNPDVPYSYPFKSIEHAEQNYTEINNLLSDLIQRGILTYDKREGNQQVFKHKVDKNSNEFKHERVNISPEQHETDRSLENMLYAVCQAHNIAAPAVIVPKNAFMTMYNRFMYPETPDAEIRSAIIMTSVAFGAAAVYCGASLANKLRY